MELSNSNNTTLPRKASDVQVHHEGDVAALLALHDATGGRHWKNLWDLTADAMTWHGVKMNAGDGRVVSLDLVDNNLRGERLPFPIVVLVVRSTVSTRIIVVVVS